ncbi:hypothetical protein MYX76_00900 [Desulfobacterota bacterium AH_259_B03_O07]|nr:hypothetical protein [Desulfobacterota bacterium AH_259_B03_O07]
MEKYLKRSLILFLYCSPCLAVLTLNLALYYEQGPGEVVEPIYQYIDYISGNKEVPDNLIKGNIVAKRLVNFLNKENLLKNLKNIRENASKTLNSIWLFNSLFILGLAILPFLILGIGLAKQFPHKHSLTDLYGIALRDWPMKCLVGFVLTFGFLYVFNPIGWGASMAYNFVSYEDVISSSNLPLIVDYKQAGMKHIVAGFLGWYLQLIGYFLYKLYKGDVISSNVYKKSFTKVLFVLGIGLILSSFTEDEGLVVVFLIGFLPQSAISMLREYSTKLVSGVQEQGASLSILPGMSRWGIQRLEEEEVDSIPTLATYNSEELKERIPPEAINPELLDYWIDMARLMTVIGAEKYKLLEGICKTATYFIQMSSDDKFKESIKEIGKISNPDEITDKIKKLLSKPSI